jgi:ketol-acid reductoisomerase
LNAGKQNKTKWAIILTHYHFREKLNQLGVCEFMDKSEFSDGVNKLKGKKIVIVGCGAQGLNQGLNLRDSGLDVSYTLRKEAIEA